MNSRKSVLPVQATAGIAWQKTYGAKSAIWAAIGVILLTVIAFAILQGIAKQTIPFLLGIVIIARQIVVSLMQAGICYIGINRAKDMTPSYQIMFRSFESPILLNLVGLAIIKFLIYFVIAMIGAISFALWGYFTLLNIICGIIWILVIPILFIYITTRLILSTALVLDKGSNPIEAVKLSFAATQDNVWAVLGLLGVQFLAILIGAIPLGIGLIWALPFATVLYGEMYKNLLPNINNR